MLRRRRKSGTAEPLAELGASLQCVIEVTPSDWEDTLVTAHAVARTAGEAAGACDRLHRRLPFPCCCEDF